MALRISLIVKSGILNSLPYVSSILPLPFLGSRTSVESSDDKEVDDGDCLGVSLGEAEIEFEEDEGEESMVRVRSSAGLRALTVDDIARWLYWVEEGNNAREERRGRGSWRSMGATGHGVDECTNCFNKASLRVYPTFVSDRRRGMERCGGWARLTSTDSPFNTELRDR